jgi:UDP-N-acetylmuramate dehydrogenase
MDAFEPLIAQGRLRTGEPLGPMTTYKVGGPARWFMEVESEQDLIDLAAVVAADPVPVMVLGRGSNLLVSDAGFDGLAVRLGRGMAGFEAFDDGTVVAGAGLPQAALARRAGGKGLGGLEFMVGIPGWVGGAVRMNAGSWGSDTSEWIVGARLIDLATGSVEDRDAASLGLRYRHSDLTDAQVVVSATFRTAARAPADCEAELREITRWRREHQPGGTYNAGSVFKNPEGDTAGQIIDRLGLKGLTIGGATVSERHANFIVAEPGATASDISSLIVEVRSRVESATGIRLEIEMRLVGDFEELV